MVCWVAMPIVSVKLYDGVLCRHKEVELVIDAVDPELMNDPVPVDPFQNLLKGDLSV